MGAGGQLSTCPADYRYSRFCELYRSWEARLSVTMRQTHVGGDKLFVDYAGDAVPVIIDRLWAWCAAPICRAGKKPCAATLADNGSGSLPHEVADTVRSPVSPLS